jgi:hypothetical protein
MNDELFACLRLTPIVAEAFEEFFQTHQDWYIAVFWL